MGKCEPPSAYTKNRPTGFADAQLHKEEKDYFTYWSAKTAVLLFNYAMFVYLLVSVHDCVLMEEILIS